jgi:hypothetical protein
MEQQQKEKTTNNGCLILFIIGLLILGYSYCKGRELRETQTPAQRCLSAWDGSNSAMVSATKQKMNDPASFEHIETRYIDRGQEIDLIMTFTGKNAFGGTVKNTVTGTINTDCELIRGPVGF